MALRLQQFSSTDGACVSPPVRCARLPEKARSQETGVRRPRAGPPTRRAGGSWALMSRGTRPGAPCVPTTEPFDFCCGHVGGSPVRPPPSRRLCRGRRCRDPWIMAFPPASHCGGYYGVCSKRDFKQLAASWISKPRGRQMSPFFPPLFGVTALSGASEMRGAASEFRWALPGTRHSDPLPSP